MAKLPRLLKPRTNETFRELYARSVKPRRTVKRVAGNPFVLLITARKPLKAKP